ncbi:hypothetical protein AALP_AA6G180700 [Arabis alpina]|uniref:Calmodulin binding protein-like N-terminal domain-containing protein n=1 Tax=Arabis alpina TaxID=50452 RepID=A0A087GPZ7_ARAAL|nr:hypothetical protein AALP_AA6G180700 [Arabis alpina]
MEPSEYPPGDENSPDRDLEPPQFLFSQHQYQRSCSSSLGVHKDTNINTKPLPVAPSSDSVLQWFPETQQLPLLKLCFINSLPPWVFTYSRIETDDGSPIAIELIDAATNARVTFDTRLKIVALDADITEESLTTEEFNRNIVRPREGKGPLLAGDLTVTLKD